MTVPSSGILASTSRRWDRCASSVTRVSRRSERYDLRLDLRQAMTAWRCGRLIVRVFETIERCRAIAHQTAMRGPHFGVPPGNALNMLSASQIGGIRLVTDGRDARLIP
ncbi:hypothetical protein [Komagataeibacter saccharivorans]|uniref:hypothetical protein n=1 Tax=Komagataeibacter saccharivorans TaxID=265959 RepID=UPI000C84B66E|nr:hypothetical protein [Komagataeibacter saccharivorans]